MQSSLLSASAINKIHLDYKVHTKKSPLIRPVSHLAYFSSLKIYLKREQDKAFILYTVCASLRIVVNRKFNDFYVAHFDESFFTCHRQC